MSKIKIIVSSNPLLTPLYSNGLDVSKYDIKILSEVQCIDTINRNEYDLALISPLVYANHNKEQDIRIIPQTALIEEDWTGYITINIAKNRKQLNSIYFDSRNEYIAAIAKIIISERFYLEPTITKDRNNADIIISTEKEPDYLHLDLSEDWFDTLEFPLIYGIWVCENSNTSVPLFSDIIDDIKAPNLPEHEHCHCVPVSNSDYERFGVRHWDWHNEFGIVLERTFDLLFERNIAPFIADARFIGKNYNEE